VSTSALCRDAGLALELAAGVDEGYPETGGYAARDAGNADGTAGRYRVAFSGSSPLAIIDSTVIASWSRVPGSAW
jgi:hypothetical protein